MNNPSYSEITNTGSIRSGGGFRYYTVELEAIKTDIMNLYSGIQFARDIINLQLTEQWIFSLIDIRTKLNVHNFNKIVSKINDSIDILNRIHLSLNSAKNNELKNQQHISKILKLLKSSFSYLKQFTSFAKIAKNSTTLCTLNSINILVEIENKLQKREYQQYNKYDKKQFLKDIKTKLNMIKETYLVDISNDKRVTSEILSVIYNIMPYFVTPNISDNTLYETIYYQIKKIRLFILKMYNIGALTDGASCKNNIQLSQYNNNNNNNNNNNIENFIMDLGLIDGGDNIMLGDDEKMIKYTDLFDMPIRQIAQQFVFAWGDIYKESRIAIKNGQTTSISETFKAILKSIIHIDRLTYVGIGIIIFAIILYVILSS